MGMSARQELISNATNNEGNPCYSRTPARRCQKIIVMTQLSSKRITLPRIHQESIDEKVQEKA